MMLNYPRMWMIVVALGISSGSCPASAQSPASNFVVLQCEDADGFVSYVKIGNNSWFFWTDDSYWSHNVCVKGVRDIRASCEINDNVFSLDHTNQYGEERSFRINRRTGAYSATIKYDNKIDSSSSTCKTSFEPKQPPKMF